MAERLSIIGKEKGDYFQIQCADCGSPTKNVYHGGDPAVPFFTAKCEKCGKTGSWKLDNARLWQGLSLQPYSRSG